MQRTKSTSTDDKKLNSASEGVKTFWDSSSEDEHEKKSNELPFKNAATTTPIDICSASPQSEVLTPFNIEPTGSFDNSPSLSLVGVVIKQIDLLSVDIGETNVKKYQENKIYDKETDDDSVIFTPQSRKNPSYKSVKFKKSSSAKRNCLKSLNKNPEFQRSKCSNNDIHYETAKSTNLISRYDINEGLSPRSTEFSPADKENTSRTPFHNIADNVSATPTSSTLMARSNINKGPSPTPLFSPELDKEAASKIPSHVTACDVDIAKTPMPSPSPYNDFECDKTIPGHEDLNTYKTVNDADTAKTPMPSPNPYNDFECHEAISGHEDLNTSPIAVEIDLVQNEATDDTHIRAKKQLKGRAEWSDTKRKRLKNLGLKHTTKSGKVVEGKSIGPPCHCKYKCYEKINKKQRKRIFKKYWYLGDRQKQWNFIVKYTTKEKKKRRLNTDTPDRRKFTYKYFLPIRKTSDSPESETVSVCKTMFMNTFNINDRIIRTAWSKYDGTTEVQEDKRGRHGNHKRVILEEMVTSVCDHVKSFAPVESHYLRKKSTKLYLDGSLNISRMYKLYNDWYDGEKYSCKAETERQYREIVTKNFNLGFHLPKKDQCDECHTYRNIKNPTTDQTTTFETHQRNKIIARTKKSNDKRDAIQSNGKLVSAVFDFEKVLTCPHGQVSIFYYKRKLSCLNFTIFDMGSKRAICYMWDETVAKRGANEVSSCLLDFIQTHAEKGVTEFRFWSDNCGGQNRNRIVFFFYIYASRKYNVTISHSFLEKGHTQNEGDSVHSVIEKASSSKLIYTPEEWRLLVRWAKADKENEYLVKNMNQDNFYDFKSHVQESTMKKDIRNQKVYWSKVKEVFVNRDDPDKLLFKYDLTDEYNTVIIKSKTRSRSSEGLPHIAKAYTTAIPLSNAKYKDLESLCKARVIPEEHAVYFKNLPHGNVTPWTLYTIFASCSPGTPTARSAYKRHVTFYEVVTFWSQKQGHSGGKPRLEKGREWPYCMKY